VVLTTQPLLAPRSRKGRAIPLPPSGLSSLLWCTVISTHKYVTPYRTEILSDRTNNIEGSVANVSRLANPPRTESSKDAEVTFICHQKGTDVSLESYMSSEARIVCCDVQDTHTHTLSLSLTHTHLHNLSLTHTHKHTLTLSHTLSYTHTLTHTNTHSLTLTHHTNRNTHTHTLIPTHTKHTHTHTHTTQTLTHTDTHTPTNTHTHTLTHTHKHSHTPHKHSHTHHTHTHTTHIHTHAK
jgi:hypothetical protein